MTTFAARTRRPRPLRRMALALASVAALLLSPSPALSQTPATTTAQTVASPTVPRGDVFAGLAVWNEDGDTLPGFHLAAAYNPSRHVGIVGDFAFYEVRTTAMGGVRVFGSSSKATVFGQFLIGSAPLDDIAFQPGFGVDIHLGQKAAIRVAGDFKISGDDGSTYVGFRFSTGVVFRMGAQ